MLEQKLVDMAVEIHDKLINTYLSKGRKLQDKMQQENGKSINEKVHLFINIGAALIRSREEGTDPFAAIENIMPWEKMVEYIEDAKILVRPQGYDYLDLIDKWYSQLRKYSPALLDTLNFSSTNTSMSPLIHSLDVLRELKGATDVMFRKIHLLSFSLKDGEGIFMEMTTVLTVTIMRWQYWLN